MLYSILDLFQPAVVLLTPVFFTWLRLYSSHTHPSNSCWHCLAIICHSYLTSAFYMIFCPRCQPWLGCLMASHSCGVTHHICNCSDSYFKSAPDSLMHCIAGGVQITVHPRHASYTGLGWFPLRLLPFSFSLAHPSYPDMTLQDKKIHLAGFADHLTWWHVIIKPS